jgi:hypothetical protein
MSTYSDSYPPTSAPLSRLVELRLAAYAAECARIEALTDEELNTEFKMDVWWFGGLESLRAGSIYASTETLGRPDLC